MCWNWFGYLFKEIWIILLEKKVLVFFGNIGRKMENEKFYGYLGVDYGSVNKRIEDKLGLIFRS